MNRKAEQPKTEGLGQSPVLSLVQSHPAFVSIAGLACKKAKKDRGPGMAGTGGGLSVLGLWMDSTAFSFTRPRRFFGNHAPLSFSYLNRDGYVPWMVGSTSYQWFLCTQARARTWNRRSSTRAPPLHCAGDPAVLLLHRCEPVVNSPPLRAPVPPPFDRYFGFPFHPSFSKGNLSGSKGNGSGFERADRTDAIDEGVPTCHGVGIVDGRARHRRRERAIRVRREAEGRDEVAGAGRRAAGRADARRVRDGDVVQGGKVAKSKPDLSTSSTTCKRDAGS